MNPWSNSIRTLVQISDLHFGNHDAALADGLAGAIERLAPDVVAISGDLTEHATAAEFISATDFFRVLPGVHIVVPGNHDLSFYNPLRRVWQRLALYRKYVTDDLEPTYSDDEMSVVGLNSARVPLFRGGRISSAQLVRLERTMTSARRIRILVTHHPFDRIVRTAAMGRLLSHVDLVLAGHMHRSGSVPSAASLSAAGQSAVVVQAGTALSLRRPSEPNAFNVIRIAQPRIEVTVWQASPAARFEPTQSAAFERSESGWIPA